MASFIKGSVRISGGIWCAATPEDTLGPLVFPTNRFRGFAAFVAAELGPGSILAEKLEVPCFGLNRNFDSRCRPSMSTKQISSSAWAGPTVRSYNRSFSCRSLRKSAAATEEFDELCFEFGIELDEDVCFTSANEGCFASRLLSLSRRQKRLRLTSKKDCRRNVLCVGFDASDRMLGLHDVR